MHVSFLFHFVPVSQYEHNRQHQFMFGAAAVCDSCYSSQCSGIVVVVWCHLNPRFPVFFKYLSKHYF